MACDFICITYSISLVFNLVTAPVYLLFMYVILKYRRSDERLSGEFFTLCLNVGFMGILPMRFMYVPSCMNMIVSAHQKR